MSVLVTGGAGFVGQHLLRLLLEEGEAEVAAGCLTGTAPTTGTLTVQQRSRVRWLPLDVTSADSIAAALDAVRPDRVYHLAGQSSVSGSFADPLANWEVNATGTLRLLEALLASGREGVRVLVVSSAEVYGTVDESDPPIAETAALRPATPYGASKAAAEMAAFDAAARGLHVVIARSFNHTGPGQDTRFALPSMARQLASMGPDDAGGALQVGNLAARRDFLDVRDVARAYRILLDAGESGEVYNVCSGEARSLRSLVEQLVDLSGTGARIEVDPARFRPVDLPLLVGDASRLRALGWTPRIDLRRTLADLLEAERDG